MRSRQDSAKFAEKGAEASLAYSEVAAAVRELLDLCADDPPLHTALCESEQAPRLVQTIAGCDSGSVQALATILRRIGCADAPAVEKACTLFEECRLDARTSGAWNDTVAFARTVCATGECRFGFEHLAGLMTLSLHHPSRHFKLRDGCKIPRSETVRSLGRRFLREHDVGALVLAIENVQSLLDVGSIKAARAAIMIHFHTGEPTTATEQVSLLLECSKLDRAGREDVLALVPLHHSVDLHAVQGAVVRQVQAVRASRRETQQQPQPLTASERSSLWVEATLRMQQSFAQALLPPHGVPKMSKFNARLDPPLRALLTDTCRASDIPAVGALGRDHRLARTLSKSWMDLPIRGWQVFMEILGSGGLATLAQARDLLTELRQSAGGHSAALGDERPAARARADRDDVNFGYLARSFEGLRTANPSFQQLLTLVKICRCPSDGDSTAAELSHEVAMGGSDRVLERLLLVEPILAAGQRETGVRVWNMHKSGNGSITTPDLTTELMKGRNIPLAWHWNIGEWKLPQPVIAAMVMKWLRHADRLFFALEKHCPSTTAPDFELKGKLFALLQRGIDVTMEVTKVALKVPKDSAHARKVLHELFDAALADAPAAALEAWTRAGAHRGLPFKVFSERLRPVGKDWLHELPRILDVFAPAMSRELSEPFVEKLAVALAGLPSPDRAPQRFRRACAGMPVQEALDVLELMVAWASAGRDFSAESFGGACRTFNAVAARGAPPRVVTARFLAFGPLALGEPDESVHRILADDASEADVRSCLTHSLRNSAGDLSLSDKLFLLRTRNASWILRDSAFNTEVGRIGTAPRKPNHAVISASDFRSVMRGLDTDACGSTGLGVVVRTALDTLAEQKFMTGLCYVFTFGSEKQKRSSIRRLAANYLDTTIYQLAEVLGLPQEKLVREALSVLKQGLGLSRSLRPSPLDFYRPGGVAPSLMERVAPEIGISSQTYGSGVLDIRGLWIERLLTRDSGAKHAILRSLLPDFHATLEEGEYARLFKGAGVAALVPPDDRKYVLSGRPMALLALLNSSPALTRMFLVPADVLPPILQRHAEPADVERNLVASGAAVLNITSPAVIGGLRNSFPSKIDPAFTASPVYRSARRDADGRPLLGSVLQGVDPREQESIKRAVDDASTAVHRMTTGLSSLLLLFKFGISRAAAGELSDPDSPGAQEAIVPALRTLYDFRHAASGARPRALQSKSMWQGLASSSFMPTVVVRVDSLVVEINGQAVGQLPDDRDGGDPEVHSAFREMTYDVRRRYPDMTFSFGDGVADA